MKKSVSALLAAILVTSLLAGVMFLIGTDAFGTSTAKAAAAASTVIPTTTVAQYEKIVKQYQAREAEYQSQVALAADQINAANQQIQQYQSLLEQLQNAGLITIAGDGTVSVNQASPGGFPLFGDRHKGGHR